MAWRADYPTRDLVCSPLVSVHSWFRLPNQMASFIQRAHLFVSLSTTFAPSRSITQLRLSAWLVMADLCSTFVASRVKRLDVTVSTFFYVFQVWYQMFFLFHQCNTYCISYMEFGTHNRFCVCLPLCLLDAPVLISLLATPSSEQ